jgi:hypothetical protein
MRAVQPNIYIGQATIGDGVVARVGLPIDRQERFSVAGWGGVQRARLVTSTSSFDTAFDLISGAASLRYRSRQYPFGMSLDYSIHAQRGYAVQGRIFPDLRRQVVLLTVSGSWPPDRGGR